MADETYTKADLDAAVAKATGDIDGLKSKIEELIGDNKKLKADLRKTQDIKPEDVAAIEAERDKAIADLTAAQKAAKDATAAAEKATKALETEQNFTHKLVAENGLVAELTKNGVTDPVYLDMAKALHIGKVKVVTEGEERSALYGDKPLADAIKEWAGTDAGKKVVAAPANSGGGAPGGGNGAAAKTMSRSAFDALGQGERAAFSKDGGKVVDQAA